MLSSLMEQSPDHSFGVGRGLGDHFSLRRIHGFHSDHHDHLYYCCHFLPWTRQLYKHCHLISITTVGFIILPILQTRKLRFRKLNVTALHNYREHHPLCFLCKWYLLDTSAVALGSMTPSFTNLVNRRFRNHTGTVQVQSPCSNHLCKPLL